MTKLRTQIRKAVYAGKIPGFTRFIDEHSGLHLVRPHQILTKEPLTDGDRVQMEYRTTTFSGLWYVVHKLGPENNLL